ncbi:MAG: RsmB/NOP family class I SAM-dependent RNA methyltransferase [Vicinamibacterales bacterium]
MIAPARAAAMQALVAVAAAPRDLGDALDDARQGLDDPRDLALLHELAVGTLRWQGRLDHALAALSRTPLDRLDLAVLVALRLGAYQLLYLTRIPPAAAVHDAVALVRRARKSSAAGLVNAVLRRLAAGEGRALPPRPAVPLATDRGAWIQHLAVVHAHPAWLVERWLARRPLGEVVAWLAFDNTTPAPTLRANPLVVASRDAAIAGLAAEGIAATASPVAPWGVRVGPGAIVASRAVADGACLIQDEGSQLAGHLAPIAPGARVLDVCAAPGGKALQYAAVAGAHGRVVAGDARLARVRLLAATVARGSAANTRVVALDPEAALPFSRPFDVVVVDAPCSGLGTLRRDPDIKWRRQPGDCARFAARQRDLLARAAACVRPGGRLVYTTCSTEPEENDQVVAAMLAARPDFRLAGAAWGDAAVAPYVGPDGLFRTDPVRDGLDGYFGAVLERVGAPPVAPGGGM